MREKYEAALGEISDVIEEYCLVVNKEMYSKLEKAQDTIMQLIENHFDNPPMKFEELEVGMWVWDKPYKRFLNTGNKYVLCEDGKYHFAPFYNDFLCGNLYDFVNTDGFDDDGNEIGYEIILKKRFENRFYRKQVEE